MHKYKGTICYLMRLDIAKSKLYEVIALLQYAVCEIQVPENSYADMQCHLQDWLEIINQKQVELMEEITQYVSANKG